MLDASSLNTFGGADDTFLFLNVEADAFIGGNLTVGGSETVNQNLTVDGTLTAGSFAPLTLELPNGSASAPPLGFQSDNKSGYFWDTTGTPGMAWTSGGNKKMKLDPTAGLTVGCPVAAGTNNMTFGAGTCSSLVSTGTGIQIPNGSLGHPSLWFASDSTSGLWFSSAGTTAAIQIGGSSQMLWTPTHNTSTVPEWFANGADSAPALSFSSSTNSGLSWNTTSSTIDTSVGGTLAMQVSGTGVTTSVPLSTGTNSLTAGSSTVSSLSSTGSVTASNFVGTGTNSSTLSTGLGVADGSGTALSLYDTTVSGLGLYLRGGASPSVGLQVSGNSNLQLVGGATPHVLSFSPFQASVNNTGTGGGTAANPAYAFVNSTNSGFYWDSTASTVSTTVGGSQMTGVSSTSFTSQVPVTAPSFIGSGTSGSSFTGPIVLPNGADSAPSLSFSSSTGSGLSYNTTSSSIDTSVGGTKVCAISNGQATFSVPLTTGLGSIAGGILSGLNFIGSGTNPNTFTSIIEVPPNGATPSYTFNGHTNSGMSLDTSNQLIDLTVSGITGFEFGTSSNLSTIAMSSGTQPMTCGTLNCDHIVSTSASNTSTFAGPLSAGSSTVSALNVTGLTASELVTTDVSKNLTSTLTMPVGVLWTNYKQTQQIFQGATTAGGTSSTSGTYMTPSGATSIRVHLQAPGAGGGGANTFTAQTGGGGGGGGGGYAELLIPSPLGSYAYVISGYGAGGAAGVTGTSPGANTTFGAGPIITITPCTGGVGSASSATPVAVGGGAAGTVSGGDWNVQGGAGGVGVTLSSTTGYSGFGGAGGPYGCQHQGRVSAGAGGPGQLWGSGGSGGLMLNGGTAFAGGNGAPGFLWVEEFYDF